MHKAKLLTLCLSLIVSLLLCEVALRIYFRAKGRQIARYQPSSVNSQTDDPRRFVSHPFLPYAPRPNDGRTMSVYRPETNQSYQVTYQLNSLGFRTPERPFEKGANVKRIVTLGGSTTFDGLTDQETWPARLEYLLSQAYPNEKIEVINLGVDMAASPTSLIDLEFIGLEYQPDLVISYDGVNDWNLIGRSGIAADYRNAYCKFDDTHKSLQARLPRWLFHSYLITYLSFRLDSATGAGDIGAQAMTAYHLPTDDKLSGMAYYERNLKLMRAAATEYHAKFLGATAHWVQPDAKAQAMNDELRTFYARERIGYLDLDTLLPHDYTLHTDAVHWTRTGIERVAEAWRDKIVRDHLIE